jgi:hypothetical protein
MDRQIEFTADDFGLDGSTNHAIESAYREGALTGASLMMGQPGTAEAVNIARRNPDLRIGWHFHACDSVPLTRARWPWGRSPVVPGLALGFWLPARRLMRREIQAQWGRFTATGLTCAFINGHHHLHIHPRIAPDMRQAVSTRFTGWVRGLGVRFFDPRLLAARGYRGLRRPAERWLAAWSPARRTDSLWGLDRLFRMQAEEVAAVLPALPPGLHEFVFHPRREGDADHTALMRLRQMGFP